MADKKKPDPFEVETTGHEWDGIQELNNPLPRWWLWTFYATIIWGIGYTIAYPAWPLIDRATAGLLGYSTRGELADEIAAHEAANASFTTALSAAEPNMLAAGSDLHRYAVARGGAVFRTNCSQCHGAGAAGFVGYPNLLDNAWLWGGDVEAISYTVRHGIRYEPDPETRYSEMPAFADILTEGEIAALADHVLTLGSGEVADNSAAVLYADNCAGCHGDAGEGTAELGAPNLADAIWLYGGDIDAVTTSIAEARFGVMPAWGSRLSEADINAVSIYVHSLGGGQ